MEIIWFAIYIANGVIDLGAKFMLPFFIENLLNLRVGFLFVFLRATTAKAA
jgi:hypothetical protein